MASNDATPCVLSEEILVKTPGYKIDEIIKGGKPKVLVECVEDIPCNPCETVCPSGSITVGTPITNLPVVELETCTGCGICISGCPGQAIFVIDPELDDENASIMIPFEFLPLPEKGDIVKACNRGGEIVCDAEVLGVNNSARNDFTPVINIKIPKAHLRDVRAISVGL